ncbi:hypothetical protein LtaPh_3324100 [Leishmania tarentolae]|uniref:DUF1279 domain-containing protein n=1 Tax=Leishmania tarentolae TaxID=5689 RepID=A0A640KSH3_LEITA|nr:hypothetical protein LtaPh_3324100 [Leishmania tarentolae]
MLHGAKAKPSRSLGAFRGLPFTNSAFPMAARRCLAQSWYSSPQARFSSWSALRETQGTRCVALPAGQRWASYCKAAAFEPIRGQILLSRRALSSAAASSAKYKNEADDTSVVEIVRASSATTSQHGTNARALTETRTDTAAEVTAESKNTEATDDPHSSKGTITEATATETTPEDQAGMWRRAWRAFKREGTDFSIFYLPFYVGTFVFFYFAFVTGLVQKESILNYVLSWMGDRVDRPKLHARIAAWNSWVNLGFAIAINELIEIVRLPVVFALYYVTRPYSNRFARWLVGVMRHLRRGNWIDGAVKV